MLFGVEMSNGTQILSHMAHNFSKKTIEGTAGMLSN